MSSTITPSPLSTRSRLFANRSLSWPFAALLVLLILALGNWRVIAGAATPQWDAADFFGPEFSLVADHIKAHHLLFWNPWSNAGTPDFAEPEMGTTSPLLLLYAYLSPAPQSGYIAYWLTVWAFGGMGMLLLAKHLRAPAWAGVVVAAGYVTCGFYTGHAEDMSSIYSVSFLPWIVWKFDAALKRKSLWCAWQAGVLFGLSALGGYPAFTILTALFLALWTLGQALFLRGADGWPGTVRKGVVAYSTTLILGGLICSPSYVGFLRSTVGYSDRNGPRARAESVSSNLLQAQALATAASPHLAALNLAPPIWPKTDVSMTSVYIGAGVVVLALFALWRRNRWRWWLFGMLCLFLLCALGEQLPVRGWLYDLVPPTRYFRNPALFRIYFLFLMAVLACLGARELEDSELARDRTIFFAGASFAAYVMIAVFEAVIHSAPKQLLSPTFALLHLLVVWPGCVYIAWKLRWGGLNKQALGQAFVALSLFDGVAALWLSKATLYSEAANPFWIQMNAGHSRELNLSAAGLDRKYLPPQELGTYPNNRNIVLKVPILQGYETMMNRYYSALVADPDLRAMALGANRFWFSAQPVWLAPDDSSFAKFVASVRTAKAPPLVLHRPELMLKISQAQSDSGEDNLAITAASSCLPATVTRVDYQPNLLAFDYSAPEAGWLLVTDRWARDWHLQVNEKTLPLTGADFLFRAVPVQPGTNRIVFTYKPQGFYVTLALSWSLLLLTLIALAARWCFRSKRPPAYAGVALA